MKEILFVLLIALMFVWLYHRIKSDVKGYTRFEYYLKDNPKWKWLYIVNGILGIIVYIGLAVGIVMCVKMLVK